MTSSADPFLSSRAGMRVLISVINTYVIGFDAPRMQGARHLILAGDSGRIRPMCDGAARMRYSPPVYPCQRPLGLAPVTAAALAGHFPRLSRDSVPSTCTN